LLARVNPKSAIYLAGPEFLNSLVDTLRDSLGRPVGLHAILRQLKRSCQHEHMGTFQGDRGLLKTRVLSQKLAPQLSIYPVMEECCGLTLRRGSFTLTLRRGSFTLTLRRGSFTTMTWASGIFNSEQRWDVKEAWIINRHPEVGSHTAFPIV